MRAGDVALAAVFLEFGNRDAVARVVAVSYTHLTLPTSDLV